MEVANPGGASAIIPKSRNLTVLRRAIQDCNVCEICRRSKPVFGEGPAHAKILIVGEQPGNEEERKGHPFVGPAGAVLNAAMRDAGLDRESVYLTNAVKAFRFEERGKRRIHQTPRPAHIATCRPWLEAEVEAIHPDRIVCLGATASQAVLGRAVKIGVERARRGAEVRWGAQVFVTYHPSAVLRAPDEAAKAELMRTLIEDLIAARDGSPQS
jgi:uracil-DNA glycosylase family protein